MEIIFFVILAIPMIIIIFVLQKVILILLEIS